MKKLEERYPQGQLAMQTSLKGELTKIMMRYVNEAKAELEVI
jgi:hypothetical protein